MKKQAMEWPVLGKCKEKRKAFDLIRGEKNVFPDLTSKIIRRYLYGIRFKTPSVQGLDTHSMLMGCSALGIIKEPSDLTVNQAIMRVIQAQRALALRYKHSDLLQYLERASWMQTAEALTAHFWPRTVNKDLYVVGEIQKLYKVHLVLAALSVQVPAYWTPWRHAGHLVGWLRIYAYGQKKQKLWVYEWDWDQGLKELTKSAEALGIKDASFIDLCCELAEGNVFAPTLRGKFARKIFAPLVFHREAKEILRHAKSKKSLLWWDEYNALVLSKSYFKQIDGYWVDLVDDSYVLWNYTIKINDKNLLIFLSDDYIRSVKSSIKEIINSSVGVQAKVYRTSEIMRGVHSWAKYCFHAKPQCNELERWVWQKLNKKILKHSKNLDALYFNIRNASWDNFLYVRKKSMLLDDISIEQWVKWWTPRR